MGLGRSKIKLSDIDTDGNGIITREEVHQYVNAEVGKWKTIYDERLDDWKDLYEEKLCVKEETIEKLRTILEVRVLEKEKETEEWKASYEDMHKKYSNLLDQMRKKSYKKSDFLPKRSGVSPQAIEAAVKDILADPNLNLKKLPDFIEKKMYYNIICIILMIFNQMYLEGQNSLKLISFYS